MRYAVLTGTPQHPRVELTLPAGAAGEDLAARLRAIKGLDADDTGDGVSAVASSALIEQLDAAGIVLDVVGHDVVDAGVEA